MYTNSDFKNAILYLKQKNDKIMYLLQKKIIGCLILIMLFF